MEEFIEGEFWSEGGIGGKNTWAWDWLRGSTTLTNFVNNMEFR